MKKLAIITTLFISALTLTAGAALAAGAEQHIGIGVRLNQPWKAAVCLNCSDEALARQQADLVTTGKTVNFVYVEQLVCDGPAAQAGLKQYDVIVAVDGARLSGMTQEEYHKAVGRIADGGEGEPAILIVKRKVSEVLTRVFSLTVVRGEYIRDYSGSCNE